MITPLRKERERRGLTQQQVADAVGIERSAYSRIENGESQSPAIAHKLALLFGNLVTRDQILYPEDYVGLPGALAKAAS